MDSTPALRAARIVVVAVKMPVNRVNLLMLWDSPEKAARKERNAAYLRAPSLDKNLLNSFLMYRVVTYVTTQNRFVQAFSRLDCYGSGNGYSGA